MADKNSNLIQAAAAKNYPNESCGVFVKRGRKVVAVECRNVSDRPQHQFLMSMEDYVAAADTGSIVGVWHTHVECDPKPSDADISGCQYSELPWTIVSIWKDGDGFRYSKPTMISPDETEVPYLGRIYVFGVHDCWSLIRDYYKREFSIELGDFERIQEFWNKGMDFFGENWKSEGFVSVRGQEPQIGDLIITQTSAVPDHISVYVGDGMIMHHAVGRLSVREPYGDFWQKHTAFHIRHNSKC